MDHDALEKLGHNAKAFAACYVKLVEALMAEGVPEAKARAEARASATLAALYREPGEEGEPWEVL